jgi:hypothetical protein
LFWILARTDSRLRSCRARFHYLSSQTVVCTVSHRTRYQRPRPPCAGSSLRLQGLALGFVSLPVQRIPALAVLDLYPCFEWVVAWTRSNSLNTSRISPLLQGFKYLSVIPPSPHRILAKASRRLHLGKKGPAPYAVDSTTFSKFPNSVIKLSVYQPTRSNCVNHRTESENQNSSPRARQDRNGEEGKRKPAIRIHSTWSLHPYPRHLLHVLFQRRLSRQQITVIDRARLWKRLCLLSLPGKAIHLEEHPNCRSITV